jgi:hypothetical protein
MKRTWIIAGLVLTFAVNAEAKGARKVNPRTAARTAYDKQVTAAAKADRALLTLSQKQASAALRAEALATKNGVAKAEIRLQNAENVANVKAERAQITASEKGEKASAKAGAFPTPVRLHLVTGADGVIRVVIQ